MIDLFDANEEREGRRREYEVDGVKYILEAEDPYGFWRIKWANGRTPKALANNSYTDFTYARDALKYYLESKTAKPAPKEQPSLDLDK